MTNGAGGGKELIAGSKDAHSPFLTMRYWLYAIRSSSSGRGGRLAGLSV
jgi:hypothetical protein